MKKRIKCNYFFNLISFFWITTVLCYLFFYPIFQIINVDNFTTTYFLGIFIIFVNFYLIYLFFNKVMTKKITNKIYKYKKKIMFMYVCLFIVKLGIYVAYICLVIKFSNIFNYYFIFISFFVPFLSILLNEINISWKSNKYNILIKYC